MKKTSKTILVSTFGLCLLTIGITAGVTLANFKSPSDDKNYNFGDSINSSDNHFQNISYYFGGGDGTFAAPYLIKNSAHLRNFSKLQNIGMISTEYFKLASSFQFEGDALEPIGNDQYPFAGYFTGNEDEDDDCSISFLKVSGSASYLGMFGKVQGSGIIEHFTLIAPTIESTYAGDINVGFIVGNFVSGTIQNTYVYGGSASYNKTRAKINWVSGNKCIMGNGYLKGMGDSDLTDSGFISDLNKSNIYTGYGTTWESGNSKSLYYDGTDIRVS